VIWLDRVICVADRTSSESSVPGDLSPSCSVDPVIQCIIGLGPWSPLLFMWVGRSDDISACRRRLAGRIFLLDGTAKLPTQATRRNAWGVLAPEALASKPTACLPTGCSESVRVCAMQIVNAQRTCICR